MSDFLLELFSEEIPARMQLSAENYLRESFAKQLNVKDVEVFSTPRRLAVIIKNLPEAQPDVSVELKGPRIDAPEAALAGFLKKNNLTLEQLENRGGIYFATLTQQGRSTTEILKDAVQEILAKFPWPKSMRWGSGTTAWVRPLHSILCVFAGKIVPVEFAGIAAGNVTYGHRFLAPAAIAINSPDEYESSLKKAFVIADRNKRKAIIAAGGGDSDLALLEEVVGLVEYPNILLGKIDDRFMDLPPEVLVTVMRSHQKYFALNSSPCRGEVRRGAEDCHRYPLAETRDFARKLRKEMTSAEQMLWEILRNKQLGVKFRKQHPIGRYVADFACVESKLIVELDGSQHADENNIKKDTERTEFLQSQGFKVLRFWNNELFDNIDGVVESIYSALHVDSPPPSLPPIGGGTLSPYFLITSNIVTEDGGKAIIAGNERVLRARFADGRFFWDTDRKKPLSEWAEGLKTVTYHAKLGTVADKVTRIGLIAEQLIGLRAFGSELQESDVMRAVSLCKADLVTGMVGEFAELQGVMGRYYAMQQGEKQEVADAIRDHYKPAGANDSVPTAPVSVCVALADKLDTLISMFAIGEKPTGSKDPFALRRAALGVIRIILENNLRIPLSSLMNSELLAFFHDRLKVQLKEQGIRHDVVNAVLGENDDDFRLIKTRAETLQEFLKTEDFINLLAAYKRAANILSAEEKKDKVSYAGKKPDNADLHEAEEKSLFALLEKIAPELNRLNKQEEFAKSISVLAKLRTPLDKFFDKTMVNCEDKNLRNARLCLLSYLRDIMDSVANFSKIEG